MRASIAYFAGAGTVVAAIAAGLRVCPGTSNGITEFSEHEAD